MGLVVLRHVDSAGTGIQPVFPALAGGFLSTVPPEKSRAPNSHVKMESLHDLALARLFLGSST